MHFRFAVHTARCSLILQQPLNNIIRIAYEALAAVLGVQPTALLLIQQAVVSSYGERLLLAKLQINEVKDLKRRDMEKYWDAIKR